MALVKRLAVGLGSLATLLLVLIGAPAALLVVGFNPATANIHTWSDLLIRLSIPDDGTLVSAVLTLLGWIAWAYLMVAIVVELVALVRRIPTPQLRGFAFGQLAAKQLLAGVALLFVAAPVLSTGPVYAAPNGPSPAPSPVVTAPQHVATQESTDRPADPGYKVVRVKAGDNLSHLARRHLGDTGKWDRIYEASKAIEQPGGRHLSDPDLIDIGWTLHVPTPKPNKHPAEAPAAPASARPQVQAPTTPSTAPAVVPAAATQQESVPEIMRAPMTEIESDPVPMWTVAVGVGSVLAAGVVGLVTARRRLQLRHWRPGLRVPMPTPSAAATEQDLRATADPLGLAAVDQALRLLSRDLAATGQPLPPLRAARLTPDHFELYLAEPASLPAPWMGTADASVWLLDGTALDEGMDPVTEIPAPYPSLVTIGVDEEQGLVLLDLEHLGSLAILGDTELTREALAALAIELAVSAWADDLTVTVVGAFSELEGSLQTGRIRYLPTVEKLIDDLEARAQADRQAMAEAGVGSLAEARTQRAAASTWPPEIVLIAGTLTTRHRNQLTELLEGMPRVAMAAVTAGEPVGEWLLNLREDRTAILEPIGLTLTPQLIPAAQYARMLDLVETATYDDLIGTSDTLDIPQDAQDAADGPQEPATAPGSLSPQDYDTPAAGSPQVAAGPAAAVASQQPPGNLPRVVDLPLIPQPVDDETDTDDDTGELAPVKSLPGPVPTILVLGAVQIENATGPVEPTKRGRLLEYAAYLLFHPDAVPADIDDAIWPARSTQDNTTTRNTANSKVRRWLGQDVAGTPYLPLNSYTLAGVASDWTSWQQLLTRGVKGSSTSDLTAALKLVRGRPFSGVKASRYPWAEVLRQEMIGQIVEAAYELGSRRLIAGDWRGVEAAIVVALSIEPALEHLWRLRILAAHRSGNTDAFNEAKARLLALTDELEIDLEPETEQLLADLATNPQRAWEKAIAQ